jgi:hypothetical protein
MHALEHDPRLAVAVDAFNRHEFFEASELFEELFFEAVRDEVHVSRALLQLAVGCVHAERRQRAAAVSRLEEGLVAMRLIEVPHGIAFDRLRPAVEHLTEAIDSGNDPVWPVIERTGA